MSANIATRQPNSTDLQTHYATWSGSASRKQRAATAANEYDVDALWSLCSAMLHEGNVSPNTVRGYRIGTIAFITWAEANGVNLLRPEHGTGNRYRQHLIDSRGGKDQANAGTVNVRLAGARVLYRAFEWADVAASDPFKHTKTVREQRAPELQRPAYSELDVARLLDAADDPHDRVMLLLGATAGLRAQEMIDLEWNGAKTSVTLPERAPTGEWADAGLMVVLGKGGTEREVWAGDELLDALEALPNRTGPVLAHVRSTSGLRYRMARLAERAGLITKARPPKGTPKRDKEMGLHRLRHRFGTDIVRSIGIEHGRVALRHASVVTTQRYAKGEGERIASFVRGLRRSG